MSKVVSFQKAKQARQKVISPLCREGFHKWQPVKNTGFDVKQGKLVTLLRCERCGAEKTEAR
ncbi:MAG TPA: hypothetical protein VFV64_07760 [Permianibacter sp.]|nr:hypothetical protein [Permianibacter sp.]